MMVFDNMMLPSEGMRLTGSTHNADVAGRGRHLFGVCAEVVARALHGNDHILGGTFSGADIMVGHSCFIARVARLLDDQPALSACLDRLARHPAYRCLYPGSVAFSS
ncbi:MAG: hypothetical protein GDA49_04450 [Rhodospirillales bacterium]|nr:hypothetical protein [Rhodospirillales bacterium]